MPARRRGIRRWFTAVLVAAALHVHGAPPAAAQPLPQDSFAPPIAGTWDPVHSIGQPHRLKPFASLGYGVDRLGEGEQAGVSGVLGVYQDLHNPVIGMLGASVEVYGGQRGELLDAGARAHFESRAFFVRAGVDWNARLQRADLTVGTTVPPRRGGWFRRAGELRFDWQPTRDNSFVAGIQIPLREPLAGRTRPRRVTVALPSPPPVTLRPPPPTGSLARAATDELGRAMNWLVTLHNFFWLPGGERLRYERAVADVRARFSAFRAELDARATLLPDRSTYESEAEHYHRSLDRAFGHALGETDAVAAAVSGRALGDRARRIVLDEVVLPYNATIGQYRKPDRLDGLAARARARFIAGLLLEHPEDEQGTRALQVFDAWIQEFESLRARIHQLTGDGRMNWLPLALVLRAEEHATQPQIDALLERALQRTFQPANATLYVNALQFQTELLRSIHETETYHVLWIHDYRGRGSDRQPDRTAFVQTAHGYLRALLDRVRVYDETGTLPVYIVILDQHSYEHNQSRVWMNLLERPLTHRVRLPRRATEMRATIAALQDSLRLAIAGSSRLRAEAEAFGEEWIESVIKVHVNITNPSDFSFRTTRLLGMPIGTDNLLRDHRKIVIRDVSERDPAEGEMILAGVGVGDWYASPTWEDRALVLQGPAALEAKHKARAVLERHGLTGARLPAPLRPMPFADDYAQRVAQLETRGAGARAMQLHNRTGWGDKEATFVQMLIYDLAPPGTVIYVPDSIWTNSEWMAQLVSAALRGCRVYIVAPSLANAPSTGFPQLSVMQELLTRLVIAREQFGDVIGAAGGELRIGLYTRTAPYDDIAGLLDEFADAFARYPFLRELYPFSPETWAAIRQAHVRYATADGDGVPPDQYDRVPKLHRKTQLVASGGVLRAIAQAPELAGMIGSLIDLHTDGPTYPSEAGPLVEQARVRAASRVPWLYERIVPATERERATLYFMIGSLNKDARSMALDGEVMMVLAGSAALQPFIDFAFLSTGATWVETIEDVDRLLPPLAPLRRWLGRRLRSVL
jgi:hypothetical protein